VVATERRSVRSDVSDGAKTASIPHRYCIQADSQPLAHLAGITQSFPSLVSESVRMRPAHQITLPLSKSQAGKRHVAMPEFDECEIGPLHAHAARKACLFRPVWRRGGRVYGVPPPRGMLPRTTFAPFSAMGPTWTQRTQGLKLVLLKPCRCSCAFPGGEKARGGQRRFKKAAF
jgi:hypothetical protein